MLQCDVRGLTLLWYFLLFLLLEGTWLIAPTSAFIIGWTAAPRTTRARSRVGDSQSPSHLFVALDDIMPLITKPPVSTTVVSPLINEFPSMLLASSTTAVSNVLQDIVQHPEVEAEVLMDVSHLVVDFSFLPNHDLRFSKDDATSFMMQSCHEQQVIRSMVGRILVLCADWLPDHHIFPEEFAIQSFFVILGLLQISRVISMDGSKKQ